MLRTERTDLPEVSEWWCGVVRVVKAAATCRLRAAGLQSPAGSPAAAILLTSLYLPAQPSTPRHLLSRQLGATYNNTIPHQHLLQIQNIGGQNIRAGVGTRGAEQKVTSCLFPNSYLYVRRVAESC